MRLYMFIESIFYINKIMCYKNKNFITYYSPIELPYLNKIINDV